MVTRNQRFPQVIFVTIFCSLISLPIVMGSWSSEPDGLAENRTIAPPPEVRLLLREPRAFFEGLDRYVGDRFGLRQHLVEWHSRLKVFALGVSPSQDVILGRNGWLYWAMRDDGDPVAYYRGEKTLTSVELTRLVNTLQARTDWMKERGVAYVFVIAPNKHGIYPEHLPNTASKLIEDSQLDRFMSYAEERTTALIVNPTERILEGKRDYPVYHRTDSHWNSYGAYLAYLSLMESLQVEFPALAPITLSPDAFVNVPGSYIYVTPSWREYLPSDVQMQVPSSGGHASHIGLGDVLRDSSIVPRESGAPCAREVPTPFRPSGWENVSDGFTALRGHDGLLTTECDVMPLNVLVIHDSFGPLLIPYMSETFGRVTYVWSGDFVFAEEFVEGADVDIVIQVHVERHLFPDYVY